MAGIADDDRKMIAREIVSGVLNGARELIREGKRARASATITRLRPKNVTQVEKSGRPPLDAIKNSDIC